MRGLRGILAGALALIGLQVLVQEGASSRVSGLFGVPAAIAQRFLNPYIPAIPDRAGTEQREALRAAASSSSTGRYPDPWTAPQIGAGGLPATPVPTSNASGGD
jgi:hypothetical protein